MALSNIGREPRREILESVIGTIVVTIVLLVDWSFAHYILKDVHNHDTGDMFLAYCGLMILGVVIAVFLYPVFFIFPHFVGEQVCAVLQKMGIDPRPKQRPGETYYNSKGKYFTAKTEAWRVQP